MRSLQKLPQSRPAPPEEQAGLELSARQSLARRERAIWLRRLRGLCSFALLVLLGFGLVWLVGGMRQVADGLVLANPIVVQAPARVRVLEVTCRPGQSVRRGDPLVRLEPLTGAEERRPLELAVEQARLRLEWFDAGGELWSFGEQLRSDRIADAQRLAREAEAERGVTAARVGSLERERMELALQLEAVGTTREGAVESAEERLAEARANAERAHVGLALSRYDTSASARLKREGVTSSRDLVSKNVIHDEARLASDGMEATQRAAEQELLTARELDDLTARQLDASLGRMDAQIAAAWTEVAAAEERRDLWLAMAEYHSRLDPGAEVDPERVRTLRRALLAAELAGAEARVAELDHRRGDRAVVAESDGVVDEVSVRGGTVVEEGTALVTYHEPAAVRVIAYATPELAPSLAIGQGCRVVVEGGGPTLEGRLVSRGTTWAVCPPFLPQRSSRHVDLRVPLVIEVAEADRVGHLAPNMRLKVVFNPSRVAGMKRRLASLFEL